MAKYNQIGYGSSGSSVTDLQKLLNQSGYKLDVDGRFGPKTQAAVRDYQTKNNLKVDGIVGDQTWGALMKGGSAYSTNSSTGSSAGQPAADAPSFDYGDYQPSDTVNQAQQMLQEHMNNKPGEYQSPWQSQLNDILNQILNREDFKYDLNGDALYQQYKDQHMLQGQQAMMDTMGQAAALTGGYGNSYAQTVGQQTYQGHLQQLNDKIPELYNLALSKYQADGQELMDQFSMVGAMEDQEYGRYRDSMSDYYAELERLINQHNTERDYDYGKWADGRDFAYGEYADDREYEYREGRDKVEDEWRQKEFDEAKRQYDQQYALQQGKSSGGSGGSGGSGSSKKSSGNGYNNGSLSSDQIKALQQALGVDADGKYGPKTKSAAGGLSAEEAYKKYVGNPGSGGGSNGFTGTTYSEACAYLKANGKQVSGLMTSSEWARHKNGNNSAGGEHEASSYAEYLAAYVYGMMN